MKTLTTCLIIAFFSLIGTFFALNTRTILMDPFTISLITAICSVTGTIFIIETHPVSIHQGIITIKTPSVNRNTGAITLSTLSFPVKDVYTIIILAIVGTILSIVVLQNLAVLE